MTRPLRVLHALDSFEGGGAQRVVLDLAAWSADQGLEVALAGAPGPLASQVDPRVTVFDAGGASLPSAVRRLARARREFRPDVLHAHQRREALLSSAVAAPGRVPVVEHAHTFLPRARGRALSFRGERTFAVSPQVADMIVRGFGRSPATVLTVGNTVDPRLSEGATPWHRTSDGRWRVIAAGRLVPQKDPLRFVRVVAALDRTVPVSAAWFGDGPLREPARRLAAELCVDIEFPGRVPSTRGVLDEADVLLLTSAWEGTPLVALEAFARRRPVVATRSSGSPGALDDGRAVVVDDDTGDDEFAAAVVRLLTDESAVRVQTEAASTWSRTVATPARVFGPVLDAYREVTGLGAVAPTAGGRA